MNLCSWLVVRGPWSVLRVTVECRCSGAFAKTPQTRLRMPSKPAPRYTYE